MLVPQGEFELERVPPDPHLQAWDAADQYLLKRVDELALPARHFRILLLNDRFGALAVALADSHPITINDSFLALLALQRNLSLNGYDADQVVFDSGLKMPVTEFDLVLIKLPKSQALLEHQLYGLRRVIGTDTRVMAAGMTRHIHSSTLELFETILGPTTTSLAWKKSRLIHVERDRSLTQGDSPYPDCFTVEAGREFRICSHANVFSRDRLDNGSRLMIENLPVSDGYRDIVDLGCGNGILGIIAAHFNAGARLTFVDESYMAVESARLNFETAFHRQREAEFRVGDCLQGFEPGSVDLVLNNPPFHQHDAVGDAMAWKMFVESRKALRRGGELWVVGNRHLAYHAKLKKIFGHCEQVASNRKFVLLKAVKRD